MLVLALHDLARLLRVADVAAAMSVEALLGTDRAFADDLVALRPHAGPGGQRREPAPRAGRLADRRQPPLRRRPRAGRLLAALRAAGQRRRARHARARRARRRARAGVGDRQPDGAARRPRRVVRQLPRRAARRSRCDFLAIAVAEVGGDRRAPHRPAARRDAARTACRRSSTAEPGVNSGLMIAQYTQAALVAENRRLAAPASVDSLPTSAMQEDHVSMGWAAARKLRTVAREPAPHPRGRADLRRARARPARAAAAGRRRRAPRSARCARASPGRAPTAGSRPTSRAAEELVAAGALLRRGRGRGGSAGVTRSARGARAARHRAVLQGLAAGGRAADADEQPRPRGRRAPGRPRRLRRHRQGRALLGGVRRDRARAARARGRRDAARAVGQAGRRLPHARVGAARADRQLEPRARVGDVGRVPPPRGPRADDVRADDRRARGSTSARRASCRARTRPSPRSRAATSAARWPGRSR